MIIILMGYMGSGKTLIAHQLASVLNYDFIDLDDYIVKHEQKTVIQLFKTKGEIYFRKKESEYLKEVINRKDNTIIALGGGTPCYSNNIKVITSQDGLISIFLKTSLSILVDRLQKEKSNRPLISHLTSNDELTEFIGKHLFERTQFYSKADYTVTTDNKSVKDIIEEILLKLV